MDNSVESHKHSSLIKNILNKDFVLSAIIPLVIYKVFSKNASEFIGLILSGIWCIAIVAAIYFQTRKINALGLFGAVFTAIGLLGTIISKDPIFYLATPIVQDFLFALILFVSIYFSHPLIQVFAEQSFLNGTHSKIKQNPKYKMNWIIITAAWGFINILQGIVRILMLKYFSIEAYYTLSNLYSGISMPLFIALSIIFSKWYMTRNKNS